MKHSKILKHDTIKYYVLKNLYNGKYVCDEHMRIKLFKTMHELRKFCNERNLNKSEFDYDILRKV